MSRRPWRSSPRGYGQSRPHMAVVAGWAGELGRWVLAVLAGRPTLVRVEAGKEPLYLVTL